MARLLDTGRIEETVRFAPQPEAKLTYALEHAPAELEVSVRYRPQEVTVVLSTENARKWAQSEQVSVSGTVDIGQETLVLLVEKDFACLDRGDEDNKDRFANPKSNTIC
jgi:hypothetical protein